MPDGLRLNEWGRAMQIIVDDEVVVDMPRTSVKELYRKYVEYETRNGRQVPSFAIEGMILSVSLFLLGQAIAARIRARDRERQGAREAELLRKLNDIESLHSTENRIRELQMLLKELGLNVRVKLETGAENELRNGFDRVLGAM